MVRSIMAYAARSPEFQPRSFFAAAAEAMRASRWNARRKAGCDTAAAGARDAESIKPRQALPACCSTPPTQLAVLDLARAELVKPAFAGLSAEAAAEVWGSRGPLRIGRSFARAGSTRRSRAKKKGRFMRRARPHVTEGEPPTRLPGHDLNRLKRSSPAPPQTAGGTRCLPPDSAGDTELRHHVERLLHAHEEAGVFCASR